MSGMAKMSGQEQLYMSLSPYTIPELFDTNIHTAIWPYLAEDKKTTVSKGHIFYNTEEKAQGMFYLKKGIVIETLMNANGLEKDFLIFQGYMVGFNYCAHEQPVFPCTKAYTECEIYPFGYDEFLTLMQRDKELLKSVIKILALDFRMANSVALQNQSCSTYEKICQNILSYFTACKYNSQIRGLKITQQLIAGLTGVHRISVVNAMKRLKQDGIVAYSNKKLVLMDYEKLQELAYGKYSIN